MALLTQLISAFYLFSVTSPNTIVRFNEECVRVMVSLIPNKCVNLITSQQTVIDLIFMQHDLKNSYTFYNHL
jgi:hypothetical protein